MRRERERERERFLRMINIADVGPVAVVLTGWAVPVNGATHLLIFEQCNRLFGLVVKASASRTEDPGFESRLRRDFSGVESYQ